MVDGIVVRTHNRFYNVKVGENTYLCSPKGNFRKSEDRDYRLPVIGDRVAVKLDKNEGVDGYITSIHARDNHLKRADAEGRRERIMAANLDRILVVSAVAKPGIDYPMLDRYLLSCRLERINCCFVINKVELDPEFDRFELDGYEEMGVPILYTSAKTGQGLDTLKEWVSEGISYLTGTSGVGKSTIINCLVPEADLATGSVDPRKGRGRHTTTNSTLVPIGGGYLVDSPGLRDFYPPKVPPEEVRFGFEEIVEVQSNCRFTSCLHDQEPGCAVFEAVEEGAISVDRYKSYLYLLGEMQAFALNKY